MKTQRLKIHSFASPLRSNTDDFASNTNAAFAQLVGTSMLHGIFIEPAVQQECRDNSTDGSVWGESGNLKDLFQPKPDGPTTVLEIPVENVKPRPLRFFLQIYIVGQQNSKDAQSWLPKETGENELEVYFKDGTGMCNIALGDTSIKIQRHGQRPSLQYLLQESLMLHGVLDELNEIAFKVEDVEDSQRLLMLDKGALDDARAKLPARQD